MSDFFGDLLALGAKMRPRCLQELHKTPQEPPKSSILEDFCWILDGFLIVFWMILGSFLVHLLIQNGQNLQTLCFIILDFGLIFECFLVAFGFIFGSSFSRLLLSCQGARPVIAEGDVDPAAPLSGRRGCVRETLPKAHDI